MRPLKLHTKTTVLVSAITVAVLAGLLALVNPRVADLVTEEQRSRGELQAINLANQISHMPLPRDPQMLARAATIVRGARPSIVAVRVWTRVGGTYVETATAPGSEPAEYLPDVTIAALRNGLASKVTLLRASGAKTSVYRVFAPITEQGRFSGAVEVVERLDDAPRIAVRFERTAFTMALTAVVFITLVTYLLFRHLVYRPVERLLFAMSRAEAGDLLAEAPQRAPDELGLLSRGFNRMITRIRKMTEEREAQRKLLEERVQEATAEVAQRNEELEERNRELGQTIRRMTELERLAAAGQTAAQFAHEVGTPLNLISGHVQLLRSRFDGDIRSQTRLETISAQIERIEKIVRGMLDRTRPEAIVLKALDLNALLGRIFDATAPELDSRNVRLRSHLEPELPLIMGNADRLQQLFINLINNALDAMSEGGLLTFTTHRDKSAAENGGGDFPGSVVVELSDTGCGMSDELRSHIFDPFYTTKGSDRGTGLGLVVVRQVVREHGGDIEVESGAGRGSLFRIRLRTAEFAAEDPQRPDAVNLEISSG
jgi:two-component system NtrC family sensor kinase